MKLNNKHSSEFKIEVIEPIILPSEIADDTVLYVFKKDMYNYTALVKGDVIGKENVVLRLHSECLFGDVLGSKKCDCGEQLHAAKERLKKAERGILLYLPHEGRGIGLRNKIEAYRLKEKGYDTAEANKQLGFAEDLREYNYTAKILKEFFKIKSAILLTNNPDKVNALRDTGITITVEPLKVVANKFNEMYLKTKKEKFGHKL